MEREGSVVYRNRLRPVNFYWCVGKQKAWSEQELVIHGSSGKGPVLQGIGQYPDAWSGRTDACFNNTCLSRPLEVLFLIMNY